MDKLTVDIKVDMRRALAGGLLAALITAGGAWAVGHLSNAEARLLMETALPSTRQLAGTVILASSTILALMLTALGVSRGASTDLKPAHYQRVRQIAFFDAAVFTMAMTVYLILNVPLTESDKVRPGWYNVIYYASLGSASLMGGSLIAIVLMIYNTVRDIIIVVGLDPSDHALIASEEEQEQRARDEQQAAKDKEQGKQAAS